MTDINSAEICFLSGDGQDEIFIPQVLIFWSHNDEIFTPGFYFGNANISRFFHLLAKSVQHKMWALSKKVIVPTKTSVPSQ